MSTGFAAPHTLAQEQLGKLLTLLADPEADLRSALPLCVHVCILLDWPDDQQWFEREIAGFVAGVELPWYRRGLVARVEWRPQGVHALITQLVEEDFAKSTESASRDILAGIDDLVRFAQSGFAAPTGETTTRWSRLDKKNVEIRQLLVFDAAQFVKLLSRMRTELLKWASQAFKVTAFADSTGDIWGQFRAEVDEFAVRAGLGGHLAAINRGLSSTEQHDWRQAMYSVRDVLHDAAKFLWRDDREEYPYLTNDKKKPIRVTESEYVNRLCAYLHQKALTGTTGAYLRAELTRLHGLNSLASKAHNQVELRDARLAAVALYAVLGEIVVRTGGEPIERFEPRQAPEEEHE